MKRQVLKCSLKTFRWNKKEANGKKISPKMSFHHTIIQSYVPRNWNGLIFSHSNFKMACYSSLVWSLPWHLCFLFERQVSKSKWNPLLSRETRPQLKCAHPGKRFDLKRLCSKTSLTTSVTFAYQTAVKLSIPLRPLWYHFVDAITRIWVSVIYVIWMIWICLNLAFGEVKLLRSIQIVEMVNCHGL